MADKLKIYKSHRLRGEDGHKVFSVRIKEDYVAELNRIATQTGRSRNEIINLLIDYGIDHCEIEGEEPK